MDRVHKFDSDIPNRKVDHKFSPDIKEDDLKLDKFEEPDTSHSKIIEAPKSFKGNLKDY